MKYRVQVEMTVEADSPVTACEIVENMCTWEAVEDFQHILVEEADGAANRKTVQQDDS